MALYDHYKKTLHDAGLKVTPARLSLLALLEREGRPMSAKDLEEHPQLTDMDQATLYRNLLNLKTSGLIRQIDFRERFSYYEINNKGDHHHLVCVQCGRIEEIKGCPVDDLAISALNDSSAFAKVLHHSLEFYGLCVQCVKH
jgi:Fe2+ or Zn2+ uptake regulation protein